MTLLELSVSYRDSEAAIRARIRDLMPLLQEARDLALLTAHYYDRSYYRNEKYTL